MTPEEFYKFMLPHAISVSRRTGVDPRLVVAQSALETGYGRSAPGNNFFGIKSHGRGGGNTLKTTEVYGGKPVSEMASFRSYQEPGQSAADYADFLLSNKRYKPVMAAQGLDAQIDAMAASGYATDPNYGAKLRQIAGRLPQSEAQNFASEAMRALGLSPIKRDGQMAQGSGGPMGQTMQMSTKSGPMGLLGAMPEEEPGGLLGLLGKKPGWASKANDIGAVLLALSGSPAAAPLLQQVQDRKKDKRETARINQTVQWLQSQDRGDLAEAVAGGMLNINDAVKSVLTGADPMVALQKQQAELNIEKTQLELQKLQAGAGADPNVQSSVALPDQSGVVLTMRDGNVVVKTVGGDTITGQGAIDYVRAAQETAAELQRGIYGARREGTLGADVALGEPAAAASARGTEIGKAQGAAITGEGGAVAKAQDAIDLIDQILNDPALPSITGMIQGRLPPMSQEGTNLDIKIKQLKGKAFLEAFESLKGGGAITETEGRAATEAMARLDRAQDDAAYSQALNELQAIMRRGKNRAQAAAEKARGQVNQVSPGRLRFNPETGDFE